MMCYAIINHKRGEGRFVIGGNALSERIVDTVSIKWSQIVFNLPEAMKGGRPADVQAWLDDAVLVEITFGSPHFFQRREEAARLVAEIKNLPE